MNWFVNLPTRSKLFISFGLVIVLLIIAIVTARNTIIKIESSQKDILNTEFANSVDLLILKANFDEVRVGLLTMMSVDNRSDKERWQQIIKENSEGIDNIILKLLERNRGNSTILESIQDLNKIYKDFKLTRDTEIIPFIFDGKVEDARRLAMGIQAGRYEKMRAIVFDLHNYAENEAGKHITESEEEVRKSVHIFLVIGIIAILIGIGVTMFLNQIIARPLKDISDMAERIASGDLTVNITADNRADEVGVLKGIFRLMVEKMQRQTRDISEAINVLASSSNEIAATTAQLASGTEQTAVAVAETTTTVEEVKQTVNLSSQKARQVSDVSQNAVQISRNGTRLVNETIDGINHIKGQMDYIAETIVKLSEHGQAIGEIIASVDDIAEQSNLLAVNAAIEASKAGEYGKGFIIVAQEIKSLAEQSKQATKQVRSILNDIQRSNTAAVMAAERGSKAVESTVKQSANTGNSIQELASSITESSQAVIQIAASSQQQLVGMDQVALAMSNIKQATAQNAASTKQVEITVRNLHDLGQRLKGMVEHYKI